MSYYTMSAQQRADNDRQAREEAAKRKGKGHKSGKSVQDVEHERYLRSMGL